MENIVLASSSPRRIDMLNKYGLAPRVIKANVEEKVFPGERPEAIAMALAYEKAFEVSERVEDTSLVIGADTLVVLDGEILGKPRDEDHAFEILKTLSGRDHKVITGICLICLANKVRIIDYDTTLVRFKTLSDERIIRYIGTKEPMDKAGAYGIQGLGEVLVEEIQGSYSNVMGLPIGRLDFLLSKYFSINLI